MFKLQEDKIEYAKYTKPAHQRCNPLTVPDLAFPYILEYMDVNGGPKFKYNIIRVSKFTIQ